MSFLPSSVSCFCFSLCYILSLCHAYLTRLRNKENKSRIPDKTICFHVVCSSDCVLELICCEATWCFCSSSLFKAPRLKLLRLLCSRWAVGLSGSKVSWRIESCGVVLPWQSLTEPLSFLFPSVAPLSSFCYTDRPIDCLPARPSVCLSDGEEFRSVSVQIPVKQAKQMLQKEVNLIKVADSPPACSASPPWCHIRVS